MVVATYNVARDVLIARLEREPKLWVRLAAARSDQTSSLRCSNSGRSRNGSDGTRARDLRCDRSEPEEAAFAEKPSNGGESGKRSVPWVR